MSLELIIEIDPDESMEPFLGHGVKSRLIAVEFEACWQIRSNLICFQTRREQIFDWQPLSASDLISSLSQHGAAPSGGFIHHRFELSGGSSLDIVAERVSIADAPPSE